MNINEAKDILLNAIWEGSFYESAIELGRPNAPSGEDVSKALNVLMYNYLFKNNEYCDWEVGSNGSYFESSCGEKIKFEVMVFQNLDEYTKCDHCDKKVRIILH